MFTASAGGYVSSEKMVDAFGDRLGYSGDDIAETDAVARVVTMRATSAWIREII